MRRLNLLLLLLLTIGLVLSVSRSANASQITINYAASVTGSSLAAIPVGNVVSGSFTYETAGVDLDPSPNHLQIDGNFISITAQTGLLNFLWSSFSSSFAATVDDALFGDAFRLGGSNATAVLSNSASLTPTNASVNFERFGAPPVGPLTSDALPTALILGDWPDTADLRLTLHLAGFGSRTIVADFTSLSSETSPNPAVPEPGTLSLLGLGLVGLAKSVRRRRRV